MRDDLAAKQRAELLARWEKVSFRIYGLLWNDARTGVGDYVRLAWRVSNAGLSADQISDEIGRIGAEFTIEGAIKEMRGANCYEGWENELRYMMYRYEEHLARTQKQNFRNEQWEKIWMCSAAKSIEHILPQSKASEKQRHRLGNLVLLPPKLNAALQAISPKEKAGAYRKTGLLIASEVADLIEDQGWKPSAIEDRENAILEWAAVEWAD